MCRERCNDVDGDSELFVQELSECLKSGEVPTITNADTNACDGSYVVAQFEVTLPSGRSLWMRMEDAYHHGLHDVIDDFAGDLLPVDCPKQEAAIEWLTFSQKMVYFENEEKHKNIKRALDDYITKLADQLKTERDKQEKEIAKEDRTRQKPMKHLDEALKILKSKHYEAVTSVLHDTEPTTDPSSQKVDELKSEIAALNARLVAVTQELDRERLLSGAQAEELDKARATLKEQAKLEKKNKKKGSA